MEFPNRGAIAVKIPSCELFYQNIIFTMTEACSGDLLKET